MRPLSEAETELCLGRCGVYNCLMHLQKAGHARVVRLLQGTHLALLVVLNWLVPSLTFVLQSLELPLECVSEAQQ